jgi:hypothetical protein
MQIMTKMRATSGVVTLELEGIQTLHMSMTQARELGMALIVWADQAERLAVREAKKAEAAPAEVASDA